MRGEAQCQGKQQPASSRCPAGAIRAEAWRSDPDHPSHQLQRGKRKLFRQLRSSGTESPEDRDAFSQRETDESAQQAKAAEMSFEEQKTFATTKEDLKQNPTDIPVAMQRQVLVIQSTDNGGCPTGSVH